MAETPLYCVCRQPYDASQFMIECDICKDWFHGSCVQVEEHHAVDIDVYHCPDCADHHGSSLSTHDYTEPDDASRPVQAGTSTFVHQLQARSFPRAEEVVVQMQGSQVTQSYLEKQGFQLPIMVPQPAGLGLRVPPPSFSVRDVEQYVGSDKVIDVIDVARQADSKMKLGGFVKYFYEPQRPKVLNVISLEMSELVGVPDVAQKMSWVENYWPDDSHFPKPFVQKYCLMGVKGSYTDFHIDFGGTSVWYHVLWGEKIFYLIRPTPANLALYEAWSSSPNQSEVFFGEKVDKCYKFVVPQGATLLLPTGWIHAVLTSQDSMAFGGNFLHNLNIGMQLKCYEMERRLKTPDLFKFPYFEAICWYVAKNLLRTLKESREDKCQPPAYLLEGVKALIIALKSWVKREVTGPATEIPERIRPYRLLKELTKALRYQEEAGQNRPIRAQGGGAWPVLVQGSCARRMAKRVARRLHEKQTPRNPSNLDILELHTREMLRMLESEPLQQDLISCRKFNKVSTASAAALQRSLDYLHLVLSNGRILREEKWQVMEESVQAKDGERTAWQQEGMVKIKIESGFLGSVKSELRNRGSSGQSEASDSESEDGCESQGEVRTQKHPGGLDCQMNCQTEWEVELCQRGYPNPMTPKSPLLLHPSKRPASNLLPITNQATKGKRPKKGMATARQRLSKILKLREHRQLFV
ncbi:hypothetical protein JZ751_016829 [Albula glossodonta]|uniref:Uncharacterized protein n=1 Tax=Albula glossodonta TaxID=121402 RepID=A0A8T2P102_9TELE|nr:hypothetical protein JZ751_016829 [Albula glossodonta]